MLVFLEIWALWDSKMKYRVVSLVIVSSEFTGKKILYINNQEFNYQGELNKFKEAQGMGKATQINDSRITIEGSFNGDKLEGYCT